MGSKPAMAADCEQWVARAVSVQGNVQVQRVGVSTWKNIKLEDRFCPGDMIRILEKSRAALVLRNEAVIRLDENTTITVKAEEKSRTLLLRLIKGAVHFFSRVPRSLKVATPFVNSTVEGTEFFVRVEASQTYFSVFRGRVRTFNDSGELLLTGGQTAITTKDQAPSMITIMRPRDAVNWSLYYPSIGTPEGSGTQKDLYSASQLLQTGQVTEAQDILTRVLNEDPGNSDALALNAIIALTLHRKEDARTLAEKAIASNPTSSPAKLALGYVQQAFFNVEIARGTMQSAAADNPENALVWARLSELWLATGYLDNALSAAEKAAALSPDISRTQTVLGYAYISQIKIQNAKEAFQKAIVFDQADPLPRLGLGLALIREGDLKAGRVQIEIAAALDPGNALVRSYLGKAFYEEKKNDLAARQYAVAKELDPNDPTPYFYDAIRKQTENRPVEAFYDLQESIEKNDNRAVYRSKLLLDEDLAARSASLGRIYRDLGFEELALVETWRSVNTDPANYSAHRLLADTYAALPRHEIARVSELLQSQLLQPINISPLQPQLFESDLFALEGVGPAQTSFNEFTPLFNRNRIALQTDGVAGSKSTWGNDLVVAGLWNRSSFSVGQFHFETDGFRDNNDQEHDIYNAFAQVSITPKTSIQAEYRYKESLWGDSVLRFDPELFWPSERNEDKIRTIRVGARHSMTPFSNLLFSFMRQSGPAHTQDEGIDISLDQTAYIAETAYLFNSEYIDITLGGGYYDMEEEEQVRYDLPFLPSIDQVNDTRHGNAYLYTTFRYPQNLTWTLGASYNDYKGELTDSDQFNPKFGLMWKPLRETTLRAAAFRVFKRDLIADQTIEPTQVAGFNQYFDDANGSDIWRYGIGIDQKIGRSLFAGAEWSRRDLEVPYLDFAPPPAPPGLIIRDADWEENTARVYLYWILHRMLTASGGFYYEKLERDPEFSAADYLHELKTLRLPFGLRFFHPLGFGAEIAATYVDQEGEFIDFLNEPTHGQDDFWVVDVGISYRLPKRYGRISLEAKNLFDASFNYQDPQTTAIQIYPNFMLLAKVTLSF